MCVCKQDTKLCRLPFRFKLGSTPGCSVLSVHTKTVSWTVSEYRRLWVKNFKFKTVVSCLESKAMTGVHPTWFTVQRLVWEGWPRGAVFQPGPRVVAFMTLGAACENLCVTKRWKSQTVCLKKLKESWGSSFWAGEKKRFQSIVVSVRTLDETGPRGWDSPAASWRQDSSTLTASVVLSPRSWSS